MTYISNGDSWILRTVMHPSAETRQASKIKLFEGIVSL